MPLPINTVIVNRARDEFLAAYSAGQSNDGIDPGYDLAEVFAYAAPPSPDATNEAIAVAVPALQAAALALTPPYGAASAWTPTGAAVADVAADYTAARAFAVLHHQPTSSLDAAFETFADFVSVGSFEFAAALQGYAAQLSPPYTDATTWQDASSTTVFVSRYAALVAYATGLGADLTPLQIPYRTFFDAALAVTYLGAVSHFEPGVPELDPPAVN
jgi:hypothetical protein